MIARIENFRNQMFERPRLANRLSLLEAGAEVKTIDGITYKVASTKGERESALRLVHDAYVGAGLIEANEFRIRATKYHLAPMTTVFLAQMDGRPIYTVSLIPDDAHGMPLDELYEDEVDQMRREGRFLAEVSCLAGRTDLFDRKRQFEIFVNLMGLMAQFARHQQVDRLMVAVHPRHAKFYQHFLGFEVFGGEKSYDSVCGKPAVGCMHDFVETDRTGYRLRDQVYAHQYHAWELCYQPMSGQERQWMAAASQFCGRSIVPMAA